MTALGLALLGLSGPAAYATAVGTWLSLAHRRYAKVTGGVGPPASVHAAEVARKWRLRRWQLRGPLPSIQHPVPVLMLHGFVGRAAHFRGMQRAFHAAGRATHPIELGWPFRGVASYTPPVVQALQRHERVDVVAHSMGGLVIRKALADHPSLRGRVRRVVTLGTPHHGTESTRGLPPGFPQDIGDLQPESRFLDALPSLSELLPAARHTAVAGQWDVVVFPTHRALPDDMARVVLPDIGHNGLLTEAAAHRAILHALQG